MKLKLFYSDGGLHPVLGQVLFASQEVVGEGEHSRYQRYIGNTLNCVAQNREACEYILSCIESVEKGKSEEVEIEGNDVDLIINKTGVQVDIYANDDWVGKPEGKFSLEEWKSALQGWNRFLALPESFESKIEVEL